MNFIVETNNKDISYKMSTIKKDELTHYTFKFASDTPQLFHMMKIEFEVPLNDIHTYWTPGQFGNRSLQMIWRDWGGFETKSTTYAPIGTLLNINNDNKYTIALSDAINTHQFAIGVSEENKTAIAKLFLLIEKQKPTTEYTVVLRIDERNIKFYAAIQDTSKWYEDFYSPMAANADCFSPMYSTWYSFHQEFTADELEKECIAFSDYGFKSIIVDDGWQTEDSKRGYAYCGDWEVSRSRIPDFSAHVDNIHALGMKYLLWYAVPFIGRHSKAYERFKDKMIYELDELETGVIDIRYEDVREYLIKTYVSAVKKYKLDGLKLDFVDCFSLKSNTKDIGSLQESFNIMFLELRKQLIEYNPHIMIEFRQNYIGPAMRQYGNIFRAADCPADFIQNRVRTADLRLLSGNTAVHSDMIMWSNQDSVESAALQIINILFSVPQISVKFDSINSDHRIMLKHWLDFWNNNKNILLSEDFRTLHPEQYYSLLQGKDKNELISISFTNSILTCKEHFEIHTIINATSNDYIAVDLDGPHTVSCYDTKGNILTTFLDSFDSIRKIEVPPSGYIILKPVTTTP